MQPPFSWLDVNTWGILGFVLFLFHFTALMQVAPSALPTARKALWIALLLVPVVGLVAYYAGARAAIRQQEVTAGAARKAARQAQARRDAEAKAQTKAARAAEAAAHADPPAEPAP